MVGLLIEVYKAWKTLAELGGAPNPRMLAAKMTVLNVRYAVQQQRVGG